MSEYRSTMMFRDEVNGGLIAPQGGALLFGPADSRLLAHNRPSYRPQGSVQDESTPDCGRSDNASLPPSWGTRWQFFERSSHLISPRNLNTAASHARKST